MPRSETLSYLLVGHIAQDLQPDGSYTLGGTVSFGGLTAHALGLHTEVLTSAAPDAKFSELSDYVTVHVVPASQNTVFENRYASGVRTQILHSRAAMLSPAGLPAGVIKPDILHLGPLDNEVDLAWLTHWPDVFVGLTPQGWLRTWDDTGLVSYKPWAEAAYVLGQADAVVLSEEDVDNDWALLSQWAQWSRLLVVTRGANGARVFVKGQDPFDAPAPQVEEVDLTGAGDVFAATFFYIYKQTRDVVRATKQAIQYASASVTFAGLSSIQTMLKTYIMEHQYE